MKEITLAATIDNLGSVTEFVETELEENGCSMKAIMQTNVIIDEIFSNIVNYAYNPDIGSATVMVDYENKCIVLKFIDCGKPYNPLEKEDPDITLSAEDREVGGLGIFMVKKLATSMQYEYKDGKNILTITKNI